MKFDYKQFDGDVYRPIIDIKVRNGANEINYEVLVDSGADGCVFEADVAELIGIDIRSGKKESFLGVTGVEESCFGHNIEIEIDGLSYETEVFFADSHSGFSGGVVGQKAFLNSLQ